MGTFVNQTLPSLHGGSIETTCTVPLTKGSIETACTVPLTKGSIDRNYAYSPFN